MQNSRDLAVVHAIISNATRTILSPSICTDIHLQQWKFWLYRPDSVQLEPCMCLKTVLFGFALSNDSINVVIKESPCVITLH